MPWQNYTNQIYQSLQEEKFHESISKGDEVTSLARNLPSRIKNSFDSVKNPDQGRERRRPQLNELNPANKLKKAIRKKELEYGWRSQGQ